MMRAVDMLEIFASVAIAGGASEMIQTQSEYA